MKLLYLENLISLNPPLVKFLPHYFFTQQFLLTPVVPVLSLIAAFVLLAVGALRLIKKNDKVELGMKKKSITSSERLIIIILTLIIIAFFLFLVIIYLLPELAVLFSG